MKLKAVLAVAAILSLGACAAPDHECNDAPRQLRDRKSVV